MTKSPFPDMPAPRTERRPVEDTRHGITRVDEFAWLRADNWQDVFKDRKSWSMGRASSSPR